MKEAYRPTKEEIKKAEETMTEEEKEMSWKRFVDIIDNPTENTIYFYTDFLNEDGCYGGNKNMKYHRMKMMEDGTFFDTTPASEREDSERTLTKEQALRNLEQALIFAEYWVKTKEEELAKTREGHERIKTILDTIKQKRD